MAPLPPSRHRPTATLLWVILGMTTTLFITMANAQQGPSIPMKYCAKVNTGNTFKAIVSDFQSDGRCDQNCTSYAFAIVREKSCWCSNLIPNQADQKPLGECNVPCPGYPTDLCGGIGLWGYMQNNDNQPTGTAPPGFGISTTAAPSKTSLPDSSKDPELTTITVEGTVKTVTITPSHTGDPSGASLQQDSTNGLHGGAVAGIIVGVIGGLIVLAVVIWMLWRKRREATNSEIGFVGPPRRGGSATGSIAAMGSIKSGPHVSENRYLQRDHGWEESKRMSLVPPTDPRMKTGLYNRDNRSHDSMASLQDNQDYSRIIAAPTRVLRVTNSDPDD
ncbi:hypothetical protein QBC38DRAFT_135345 [Podospora fimiseda]|uniref:WSC domain-containing protein n=1 Tax=Podospora fimiseda TaxID=252190 RepID=A0AAN7H481_9PEZI|nr:hypothetical protein QBC38DRAFT_135345 [Podospora fimiseda]